MQKDEITRVTTFIYTLLTQNALSGYLPYPCTITGASPSKPTGKILFSPILQDVFIPVSACASHHPAAFCRLSLLLLILFFVFDAINCKKANYNSLLFQRKFLHLSNSFSRIFHYFMVQYYCNKLYNIQGGDVCL